MDWNKCGLDLPMICMLFFISVPTLGIRVSSKLGTIEGFIDEVNVGPNKVNIAKYLGIPYAKPPLGNLRFAKPEPLGKFQQPFNATEYAASCQQYYPIVTDLIVAKDEDCLYLNVFSPDVGQSGTKYPVMIWIHGGSFLFGDGRWRTYEKLAAFGKVILVTMNYRLGPFGFLDSGDDTVVGNYGLWDQHMAIQWVHDNIESFNGDPELVTLFGESAGSASVMYQAIYPGNSGLFQRVIAQSGFANAEWAVVSDPASKMKIFAERMGCLRDTSDEIIDCLRIITNTTSISMNALITSTTGQGTDFGPTVDGDFITQERRDALNLPLGQSRLDYFNKLDIIMGTTGAEGESFIGLSIGQSLNILSSTNTSETEAKTVLKEVMKKSLSTLYDENGVMGLLDAVLFQFSDFQNDRNSRMSKIVEYITDVLFFVSGYSSLLNHNYKNTENKTYNYEFNELYPFLPASPWLKGARHAEDIEYMFGTVYDTGLKQNMSKPELDEQWKLSNAMMTYWTNFAKSGDPNKPVIPEVIWKPFNDKERSYLYLTSAEIKNKNHLHAERVAFWLDYVPKLLKKVEVEKTKVVECSNANPGLVSNVIFTFCVLLMSVCMKINFVYI